MKCRSSPGGARWGCAPDEEGETRSKKRVSGVIIIFSLSLPPRIASYIEEADGAEETWGGATRRSLNPGKEGPREAERRGRCSSSHGRGAELRQRHGRAQKTAPSSKKKGPQQGAISADQGSAA